MLLGIKSSDWKHWYPVVFHVKSAFWQRKPDAGYLSFSESAAAVFTAYMPGDVRPPTDRLSHTGPIRTGPFYRLFSTAPFETPVNARGIGRPVINEPKHERVSQT